MKNSKEEQLSFQNIDYFLDLGNHIAYYRRKKGYTQKRLAECVGVTQTYISKIESDNCVVSFSMNVFFSICHELNVSPQKMFEPLP